MLSIIVPTLNEAEAIVASLRGLQDLRARGHEVLLADGGSADDTLELARPLVDRALSGPPGRAGQMNAAAQHARGAVLVFLHADTTLPDDADRAILEGLEQDGRRVWGFFRVRLTGRHVLLRVVEAFMNGRSRFSGIGTGDQALFVRRELFETVGGFPNIPLMEDVALSRALKAHGRPLWLSEPVVTSSRRWEQRGIARTILLMWGLRLAYFLGTDPARLARYYAAVR